jgi:hypothetical protein
MAADNNLIRHIMMKNNMMKNNKIGVWIFFALLGMLSSCSKDEIDTWAGQNYAWFGKSEVNFTFRNVPNATTGTTALAGIPIHVAANVSDQDRKVNVEVIKQPSNSQTQVEVQNPAIFHANAVYGDTLWVKVTDTKNLDEKADSIKFRIIDSDDFKAGLRDSLEATLVLYNGYAQPSWWDKDAEFYLGKFTQLKMDIYWKLFGGDSDPRGKGTSWYNNIEVDYRQMMLQNYVEENNIVYPLDGDYHPGEAPVFGYNGI